MENYVAIEWYRVRLKGEPVLGEQRNPSTKQNSLGFCDDGERYIFRDIYPDGRYTVTYFNHADVQQLVVKIAGDWEKEDGVEA